jgi:S-adenosylmethionine:tRNA ribosyltransferase-isomerase
MNVGEFEFELPTDLIPAAPTRPRGSSRMLVVDRRSGELAHRSFTDLPEYLHPGDVLVLNDTKVMPTVLRGRADDGAQVRLDLVSKKGGGRWDCFVRRVRALEPGTRLTFADGALEGIIVGPNDFGTGTLVDLSLEGPELIEVLVAYAGYMLPMYLDQDVKGDDYQTVYANEAGSNQPPVAGMHFTEEMFDRLAAQGVHAHHITLRIGRLDNLSLLGEEAEVQEHRMYAEAYEVPQKTADALNAARRDGHRIVCIGTTSVRTLETVADADGVVHPGHGWTDCYITPGHRFKAVDALLSNLQPPKTTNVILHASFAGTELVMRAYREAVAERYQFLEFGDCVFYH